MIFFRSQSLWLHVLTYLVRDIMAAIAQTAFWNVFLDDSVWIPVEIALNLFYKGPIDNIPALI